LDVYIVRLDDTLQNEVYELASFLRSNNLSVDYDYMKRSVKSQMREANKFNTRVTLFIGGAEYKDEMVNAKDMISSEEQSIRIKDGNKANFIVGDLKAFLAKERGLCMYQTKELGSCQNKVKTGIRYCKKHDIQLSK
jgi:histidyl-tRNA synthetase